MKKLLNIKNSPMKLKVPGKLKFETINIKKNTENNGINCTIPL